MTTFSFSSAARRFCVSVFLLLLAHAASAQWGNFSIDTLEIPTILQRHTNLESLEIDDSGFLHAVWTSERTGPTGGKWILYNTTRPNGQWQPTPDTVNTSQQIAFTPVLAVLPESGVPVVAFEANSELISALLSGGEWSHQTTAAEPIFLCCPTIDVDDGGMVHLAWIGEEPFVDLYHIAYMRVIWGADPQLLLGTNLGMFGLGADPKLAVSPEGIAHITYRGGGYEDYHIEHACNSAPGDTNWTIEGLFTPNQEDLSSDIALDGYDIHVAIGGDNGWGMPGHVYYMQKPGGGTWSPPEFVTGRMSAVNPTMALDGNGTPHMLVMATSGNLYTGFVHYFVRQASDNWLGYALIGEDHFNPCLRIGPDGYGHAVMNTGGNTSIYGVLHLRSETPLANVPQISISPDTLRFGFVQVGSDSTLLLTIANTGTAPLAIDTAFCSFGFSAQFVHFPFQIQPGEQVQPGITFFPGMPREYNGVCEIRHNGPGGVTLAPLHGTGVIGQAPGPFSRLLPADSSHDPWYEFPSVQFVWSNSIDPDGTPVTYALQVWSPDYAEYNEVFVTADTSQLVEIPVPVLDEIFTFYWRVHATDGHWITEAENGTGVFFLDIAHADIEPETIAREYGLTAYPNPFNPVTTIAASLPRATEVRLAIYDVQGRRIRVLRDEPMTAGTHRISFDGSALPTGVYFARLEAANIVRTEKLLLLK
ncbi:T9SS type A sorting domain-containing protein [bacterium]|nr:T9SS type A sorting domain-containing protein [bacterium]MBU1982909.1 T9SS type A sorting domain-containing protein [bacterium]